ncbi:family 2 glycosyl transferase [Nostoc sp. HK-01]|nr:family 2 glycosyl transferase [Nostoc sp. HK-01]
MYYDLSIIIPAYNRAEMLKYTLQSIKNAIHNLNVEVIIVDDGSKKPLSEQLQGFLNLPIRFIRQINQGSIVARNRGLKEAEGKYVLFLDSDDLVHADKLTLQVSDLEESQADVSYTDEATVKLKEEYSNLVFQPKRILRHVNHSAEFYLAVQPIPSNPIYRRSYLVQYLSNPLVPENRIFDPVGDVWIYYNLAAYDAKITKINGHYSIAGEHEQERYTDHWENLGVASLAVMMSFMKNCPSSDLTHEARRLVGECAFISWRKLPKNFNSAFEHNMMDIWQKAPKGSLNHLGGRFFQTLAKLIGAKNAAFVLRHIQRPDYSQIQTVSFEDLKEMVAILHSI